MPPKRRIKRKAGTATSATDDGQESLSVPDRKTWPGWVEMESEPAFFNVMLREMGARGVKVQEIYDIDPAQLAILPQPVHALIFLFRYCDEDQQQEGVEAEADHIWFANQIPDFACATVALLNIINNIPNLDMGKELRDFKDFTKDMTPVLKGDMIDNFDFVRSIHNSFATDKDILEADMHLKEKMVKTRKTMATAKARETKRVKKAANKPLRETSSNVTSDSIRTSGRARKSTMRASQEKSTLAKDSKMNSGTVTRPTSSLAEKEDRQSAPAAQEHEAAKLESNAEEGQNPRRSTRKPKPRNDLFEPTPKESAEPAGFHFIAYVPIADHVWKLDGLDWHPTDLGTFGKGADDNGDWIHVVTPAISDRMLRFQDASIEFNLMAVVHDPAVEERKRILKNIKSLQAVETKLSALAEEWTKDAQQGENAITGSSADVGIVEADLDTVELPPDWENLIAEEDNVPELIKIRQDILDQQLLLHAGLRDATNSTLDDEEQARQRRHPGYPEFVHGWLNALAENGLLEELI